MRRVPVLLVALLVGGPLLIAWASPRAEAKEKIDKKAIETLAKKWFKARPPTRFERWDPQVRAALLSEAEAIGPIPEGRLEAVRDLLWKTVKKTAPKFRKDEFDTPYGPGSAAWDRSGGSGKNPGLVIGLHGGGEGVGDKGEAKGKWVFPKCVGLYPQGIRLVHDTWNTVHGEAFVLTLIEWAKAKHGVDPDRVYVAGFSMGGTGSFHMAGRHPDLFAAAIPAHGVVMAQPKSQVWTKEEVQTVQYGLLPNLRNVPVWFYTGSADANCRPGTFLYVWDLIQQLEEDDPGGYEDVRFDIREGLAHAFPPGEPQKSIRWALGKRRQAFPEKLVWEYAVNPYPLPDAKDKVTRPAKRWFYWLYCDQPADSMQVTAVRKGNEFDLEVTRAFPEDFTIYLRPEMIDVEADVVVRVDGEEVYRGKPRPDFVSVLVSLDARLDRTLVFDRRIRIPE